MEEIRYITRAELEAGITGRQTVPQAHGDTPGEVEQAAVARAREFFGPDTPLAVRRDYIVSEATSTDMLNPDCKRWTASVTVYEILPEDERPVRATIGQPVPAGEPWPPAPGLS